MRQPPAALGSVLSPVKNNLTKVSNANAHKYSRQKVQNVNQPQMGGSKAMPKRVSSSQQRMESGGYNRAYLRNGGMGVIASRGTNHGMEALDGEFDMQQVPIKIFEMHGQVRAPLRAEEMQGTTIYKTDMDYHGMVASSQRVSSKHMRSREKAHRKSKVKLPTDQKNAGYKVGNPLYTQSLPLRNDAGGGAKCSPIITTHPYKLGFLY